MRELTLLEKEALYQLLSQNYEFGKKLLKTGRSFFKNGLNIKKRRFQKFQPFDNLEIIEFWETEQKVISFQNNKMIIFEENDRKHRFGGPAVIYPDGRKEWWENGQPTEQNLLKTRGFK